MYGKQPLQYFTDELSIVKKWLTQHTSEFDRKERFVEYFLDLLILDKGENNVFEGGEIKIWATFYSFEEPLARYTIITDKERDFEHGFMSAIAMIYQNFGESIICDECGDYMPFQVECRHCGGNCSFDLNYFENWC